jgi:methylthioribose-1-phosphate isomerase
MVNAITWKGNGVRFLDQSKLPLEELYVETDRYTDLAEAIRTLSIRGAPLIGVAAAYGTALAALEAQREHVPIDPFVDKAINTLLQTRPTAVNLSCALDRMRRVLTMQLSPGEKCSKYVQEAIAIHREDEMMCRSIGEAGSVLVPLNATILTHCNAGALATGGEGTALGVVFTAARQGKVARVYACETRPALQGARLTTWELMKAGIDVTLITDSTAAFLMQQKKIDLVIVGADRIAANGDTANKIGTYMHALSAHAHAIPMYIAAPGSTIDPALPDGSSIPIEERSGDELTEWGNRRIAPAGVKTYTPAFDVTPSTLITAIITERGIFRPPYHFHRAYK